MESTKPIGNEPVERRHFRRIRTLLSGHLSEGDHAVDGVVVDLSVGGAMVRVDEPSARGAMLRLRVGSVGEFWGRVEWRARKCMGIRFVDAPAETAAVMSDLLPDECLVGAA